MSRGTLTPTRRRRTLTPISDSHWLCENVAAGVSPLKIDREAGIIYGVRVLGRYSRNNRNGSTEGTEYLPSTQQAAVALLEGTSVKVDHPIDRTRPAAGRNIEDTFGVLRNPRVDGDQTRADLHYYKSHAMADQVLEDVERQLGQFGLSINANTFGRVQNGVYVVEEIGVFNSVDIVDRPATNRNLWESLESPAVKHTVKSVLESQRKRFAKSPARTAWLVRVLEDDGMADVMSSEMDAPAVDPDEALKDGFEAAIMAIVQGEGDAAAKGAKVKELLKAHEKLMSKAEPEAPAAAKESESEAKPSEKKDDDVDKPKMESLEREAAVNKLCRAEGYIPSEVVFESLCGLPTEDKRKALITEAKAAKVDATGKPAGAGNGVSDKPRSRLAGNVIESRDEDYANDSWGRATKVAAGSKN